MMLTAAETTGATKSDGEKAKEDKASVAKGDKSIVDSIQVGPVGDVRLKNGTVLELTRFKKIGKYYIYISGKLNGRSSTVISLTRLDDLKRWKSIQFKDPYNFIISSGKDKRLNFLDSRMYIGSDSYDSFTFYTTPEGSYEAEEITVKKKDVATINIIQPKKER